MNGEGLIVVILCVGGAALITHHRVRLVHAGNPVPAYLRIAEAAAWALAIIGVAALTLQRLGRTD